MVVLTDDTCVYIKLLSFGTEIYRLDVPRIFKIQCYLK